MKKLIIPVLIISLAVTACTVEKPNAATNTAQQEAQKPAAEQTVEQAPVEKTPADIASDFDKLLLEHKKPNEIVKFTDSYIEKADQGQATKMVEGIISSQKDFILEYMDKIHEGNNYQLLADCFGPSFDERKLKDMKSEDLKALLQEIIDGGYIIHVVEGDYVLAADYEKLKKYDKYINEELKTYIALEAEESKSPAVMDDGFRIPIDEVAARIAAAEKYYRDYSDSPRGEKVGMVNKSMISLYLSGVGNTPVFDYQLKKINVDYLKSYKKTIRDYDGTVFAEIVKEYLKIIEKNGFNKSQEAVDYPGKSELLNNYTKHVKQGIKNK